MRRLWLNPWGHRITCAGGTIHSAKLTGRAIGYGLGCATIITIVGAWVVLQSVHDTPFPGWLIIGAFVFPLIGVLTWLKVDSPIIWLIAFAAGFVLWTFVFASLSQYWKRRREGKR